MPLFGLKGKPDIKKLQARQDVDGLIAALDYDKDSSIQDAAQIALSDIASPVVLTRLVMLVKQGTENKYVLLALANIGAPAVPFLIDLFDEPSFPPAVVVLTWIGEPAIEPLIAAYARNESVRINAEITLVRIGAPAASPLIAALKNEDRDVRWSAARALEQIGSKLEDAALRMRAVDVLIGALDDPEFLVSGAAEDALKAITGQDLGKESARWRKWWEKQG